MTDFTKNYDPERVRKVREELGGEDPAKVVISLRDALEIIHSDQPVRSFKLTKQQRELVEALSKTINNEVTDAMVAAMLKNDVWLAVDNFKKEAGHFSKHNKLITVLFKDHKNPIVQFMADSNKNERPDTLNHELTHGMQHFIWRNSEAPNDVRSLDYGMWKLFTETQAELVASSISKKITGPDDAYERFITIFKGHADFYRRHYGIDNSRMDDGKPIPVDAIINSFGIIPGVCGNFLKDRFSSIDDVYRDVYCQSKALASIYDKAKSSMRVFAKDDLLKQDEGNETHAAVSPDDNYIVIAKAKKLDAHTQATECTTYRLLYEKDGNKIYGLLDNNKTTTKYTDMEASLKLGHHVTFSANNELEITAHFFNDKIVIEMPKYDFKSEKQFRLGMDIDDGLGNGLKNAPGLGASFDKASVGLIAEQTAQTDSMSLIKTQTLPKYS